MHSCDICRTKAKTAGELLAWHTNHSAETLQQEAKPRKVMGWLDMFDPFMNGNKTNYKLIDGGVTGAWKGLPSS